MARRRLACFDCHLVMTQMSRSAQLAPPYVAPWNNRRTWGLAMGGRHPRGNFHRRDFSPPPVLAAIGANGAAMSLLDFARGPGLHWALVIMVAGFFWRGADFALRRGEPQPALGAQGTSRSDSAMANRQLRDARRIADRDVRFRAAHPVHRRRSLGIQWPSLPTAIVLAAAVISIAAMVAGLVHRITTSEPSIFSAFDDYFTWSAVFVAMLTGLAVLIRTLAARR